MNVMVGIRRIEDSCNEEEDLFMIYTTTWVMEQY